MTGNPRVLENRFQIQDDRGRVVEAGGTLPTGGLLRFKMVKAESEPPSATFDFLAGDDVFLRVDVRLDARLGEARMQAQGNGLHYYWWLGGGDSPAIEGNANGESFTVAVDPETGLLPTDLSLDRFLPRNISDLLALLVPSLDLAAASVAPPSLEPEGREGPGAQPIRARWWRAWGRRKHNCWGLFAAAGGIVCAGASTVGPIGSFVGCPLALYVFGTAASICADAAG